MMQKLNLRKRVVLLAGFLITGLSLSVFGQLQVTGQGADLFIQNATLLTITNGTIENGAVWIQNGKIKAVGRNLAVPDNARVVDASRKYVMPGIIDSHSHMAIEGGINEFTGQVTPEVSIEDVIRHDDISLQRALAGGVVAINTLHGSANVIGGQNAIIKLKFGKPAEQLFIPGAMKGLKFALGENPKRSNFQTSAEKKFPATRMGIEVTLRDAFTRAKEYMRRWDEYEKKRAGKLPKNQWEKKAGLTPPRKDLRMETLIEVLKGERSPIVHAYRADEMLMIMQVAEDFGFKIGSFEHCLEGYKIADEIARHGAIASIFADMWGYKMEAFDAIPYDAAVLTEHGVLVTINSDSEERTRRLYQEAAKTIKYGGISEEDALKMITLNPAKMLHIDDRMGSLEVGKDGDLAIFSGHPFSVYSKVEMTIVEGDILFDLAQAKTTAKVLADAAASKNKTESNTKNKEGQR